MEKTIEERASNQNGGLESNTHIRIYQLGYIKGATEQKAIDKEKADVACGNSYRNGYYDAIDKACEWLENEAWIDGLEFRFTIDDFRKAMEG